MEWSVLLLLLSSSLNVKNNKHTTSFWPFCHWKGNSHQPLSDSNKQTHAHTHTYTHSNASTKSVEAVGAVGRPKLILQAGGVAFWKFNYFSALWKAPQSFADFFIINLKPKKSIPPLQNVPGLQSFVFPLTFDKPHKFPITSNMFTYEHCTPHSIYHKEKKK